MPEPSPSSNWPARALKWVGVVTAVISLVLGVRQLTSWIGDVYGRQREAATLVDVARQQASRGEFAAAWTSLDRAAEVRPGEAVDDARVEIAFAWLEDARPGPGQRFAVITDAVTPALDRALVSAQGERRADLLAHLGWVTFLRLRDGYDVDPAARYQEALTVDPDNVFANAMLGHWLMWRGRQIQPARERFDTALAAAGERRPFVRRLQLAALTNGNARRRAAARRQRHAHAERASRSGGGGSRVLRLYAEVRPERRAYARPRPDGAVGRSGDHVRVDRRGVAVGAALRHRRIGAGCAARRRHPQVSHIAGQRLANQGLSSPGRQHPRTS